jgi:hypothetical protein
MIRILKQWYVPYTYRTNTNPPLQCTAVGSEIRGAIKKTTATVMTAAYQMVAPSNITGDLERLNFIKTRASDLLANKKFLHASKWKDVRHCFSSQVIC